jgi:hypothetical protein
MKVVSLTSKIAAGLAAAILVLAPFWASASVWLASGVGHYTAIRLALEVLLLLMMLAVAALLLLDRKLAVKLMQQKWLWPLASFVILEIVWGLVAYATKAVSLKALGYAWVVDLRYPLFFVAVYVAASKNDFLSRHWPRLIFIPAAIVAVFAVLQFAVLPLNFLTHFGYNAHTIFPYETINHNAGYPRAMSFTRGANPLGAYLLIIATLLLAVLTKRKNKSWKIAGLLLTLAALMFSFSRSAWLGAIVSFVLLAWLMISSPKLRKLFLGAGTVVIIIFAILFIGLRNNAHFQNYFLHTQQHSTSKVSSNAGHLSALESGLSDFARDPLGNGPGTSGPASLYNREAPSRNTENYYLMIGEEDGWLGLALLLAFFVLVAIELARQKTKLALGLFASFIGLAVVNFLLPAWTDITLAYIFWGLTGIAIATSAGKAKNREV